MFIFTPIFTHPHPQDSQSARHQIKQDLVTSEQPRESDENSSDGITDESDGPILITTHLFIIRKTALYYDSEIEFYPTAALYRI